MKSKIIKTIKQLFKYGIVGISNTLITLAVIFIFMKLLNVSYIISNAVGFLFGFINSFMLNRIWTFKSKEPMGRESLFYIMIFGACYILQLILLIVLKEKLLIKPEYSQIIAILFYSILNFSGNKYITFKKVN